jgi:hypothetical protein
MRTGSMRRPVQYACTCAVTAVCLHMARNCSACTHVQLQGKASSTLRAQAAGNTMRKVCCSILHMCKH